MIVLISPQVLIPKNTIRRCQPPLGIAYLAAVLEEAEYEVLCIDAVVMGYDNVVELTDGSGFVKYGADTQQIVDLISKHNVTCVGVTSLFSSMTECAFDITRQIKKQLPHIPIVMGGNHASNTATEILANEMSVDFVLKGEAEYSFLSFVERLGTGKIHDVPGLCYRDLDQKIVINETASFIDDLDQLPDPGFHLFDMERYFEIGMPHNPFVKSGRVGSIMTSRGCPEHCYFCTSPTYTGTKFRSISATRVIQQVDKLVALYGIKEIQILDDNFTVDARRVIAICDGIAHHNLRITLPNAIRADMPTNQEKRRRMYKSMANAGVEQISISVEHGNQEFLNAVTRKRLNLDEVRASCHIAHDCGILVHANFMMGFPFEDARLRKETREFALSLEADSFSVSITQPLPGTPLWQIVEENKLFMSTFSVTRMTYVEVNIIPHDISAAELIDEVEALNSELNTRAREHSSMANAKYKLFEDTGKQSAGDRKYRTQFIKTASI